MKEYIFYIGLSLFFTHELDAMSKHEWQLIPILNQFSNQLGEKLFLIFHIPLFVIIIAFVASANNKIRNWTQRVLCLFFIVHAALHGYFSTDSSYEFISTLSSLIIYGAGTSGALYFLIVFGSRKNYIL